MTKEMVLTELSMLERQAELEQLDVKLHSAQAHIDQQFDESLSHLNAFVEDIRLASKEISKSLAKHETVLDLPTTCVSLSPSPLPPLPNASVCMRGGFPTVSS